MQEQEKAAAAADRQQEDDATMRDMEAKLRAEKEAHAQRLSAERLRLRQHQQAVVAPRKAVPTVAMRGRPAGALRRKGPGSAAAVFSRGDSSDEEDGDAKADKGRKEEAVPSASSAAVAAAAAGAGVPLSGVDVGEEEALTEEAMAMIRKTAELLAGDAAKGAALSVKARSDSKLR